MYAASHQLRAARPVTGLPRTSFFHSGDALRVLVQDGTVQERPDAPEKLEGVTEIVAVIGIESVRGRLIVH